MTHISNLIEQSDYCPLILLIAILCFIGSKVVETRPGLRTWGVRIAVATFVSFAIMKVAEVESHTAQSLLWAVVSAMFAAGLVLGPAWIILAMLRFFCRTVSEGHNRARRRAEQFRSETETTRRERELRRQQAAQEEFTPDQQRALREAEEQRRVAEQAERTDARRREDARVACELLYNLYAAHLQDRFPQEAFDRFVQTYMTDEQPPDVVEQRAGQLQATIQQQYEQVNPPDNFTDLGQVARWYEKQKKKIERLGVHQSFKDDYLVQLNERYAELTQRVLEKQEP